MTLNPSGTLALSPQLVLRLEDYAKSGLHVAVLGATGAGKSNAVRVFCEQALHRGITTMVVDPEGEYHTLGDAFPTIVVGGEHGHVPLPSGQADDYAKPAAALAQLAIAHQGVAIVLDLSLLPKPVQQEAYHAFSAALFRAKLTDSPIVFVTEEAEMFAPESGAGKSSCIDTAEAIAKRGRKRGIMSVWAPHRTADLSKRILSQCGLTLVGRLNWDGDFRAVQRYLPPSATFETVKALPLGHFYVSTLDKVVAVNKSQTANPGDETNGRVATASPPANMAALIKSIAQVFSAKEIHKAHTPTNNPDDGQLAALNVQVASLQEDLRKETARAGLAELGLRRSDEALKHSETARGRSESRRKELEATVESFQPKQEALNGFRSELLRFLGLDDEVKVAFQGSPQQVAELAKLVRAQLVQEGFGQAGGTVVEVREAVLLDFQRDAAERILARARAATPQARKALLWLEAMGKPATITDIAAAFGILRGSGDPYIKFTREFGVFTLSGLARHDNKWYESNIHGLVLGELAQHGAREEQVGAVVQQVMVELRRPG